ncbi:MAG: hypothetical protein IT381_33040 [Deltaproteobacteria bacterium]|nr:hypothetical protein [Deltaproteobacteria bacterium]
MARRPRPASEETTATRTGITTVSLGDTNVAEFDSKLERIGWNRSFFFRKVARQLMNGDYFDPESLPPEIREEVKVYAGEILGIESSAQRAYEAIVLEWFKARLADKPKAKR